MSKLLTVKDMALRLVLTVGTIHKHLKKKGKLPKGFKVCGEWRWREETVEEWEKGLEDK